MIVLITGASGGLGEVLGELLVRKGMTVYGTMRNPPSPSPYPYRILPMQIRDAASIDACVQEVLDREGRIDVLINCVNRMVIGSMDEQTLEDVEEVLDTNVMGAVRLFKAVTPIMLRQGAGTMVMLSSAAGIVAVPHMGAYSASKFALEAFAESHYHELRGSGIDIVIMQPVAMKMHRGDTGAHLSLLPGVTSDSRSHNVVRRMAKDTAASTLTPEMVAAKIHEVITSERKPLRVPMNKTKAISVARRIAPQFVIDRLLADVIR